MHPGASVWRGRGRTPGIALRYAYRGVAHTVFCQNVRIYIISPFWREILFFVTDTTNVVKTPVSDSDTLKECAYDHHKSRI